MMHPCRTTPLCAKRRAAAAAFALAALCSGFAGASRADDYPAKAVTVYVAYPAGGTSDVFARIVAKGFAARFGRPFVVENRPGAAGQVGSQIVAKAPPNGYTLLVTNESPITVVPSLRSNLPYDPIADFDPISIAATLPFVLVARSELGVKSVAELLKVAKSKSAGLSYGSTGLGGISHLLTEAFSAQTGVKMVHVPYKGGPAAMADVIAGRVDLFFAVTSTALPHAENPQVRFLAIASPGRIPNAPRLPTLAEEGIANFAFGSWFGMLAPAKIPKEVKAKLSTAMIEILNAPESKKFIAEQGALLVASTPEEAVATIAADLARWRRVAAASKISLDDAK